MDTWSTSPYTNPLPTEQARSGAPSKVQRRMWPVLLTLYFLSPLFAEVLSGSTPPLLFIQPFGFIFVPLLYGSSAILIREVLLRRLLGWGNALVLGAAFGVFQEALVVQTWYNFIAKSSPSHQDSLYGVSLGTSWVWALNLTIYHAVISITLPLILLGLLFPQRARTPGLKRRGVMLFLLWLVLPCGVLAVVVARTQYAKEGYYGPPLGGYLIACALTVGLVLIGSFLRIPSPRSRSRKRVPGVWTVRVTMFGLSVLLFLFSFVLPATKISPLVTIAVVVGIFSFGLWRIASWSARDEWSDRHWLSLVIGLVGWYLLIWGPLVEFVVRLPLREGLTLANVIVMLALFLLDWRLRRRRAHSAISPLALDLHN